MSLIQYRPVASPEPALGPLRVSLRDSRLVRWKRLVLMVAGLFVQPGCATIERQAFSLREQQEASISAIPAARFWADAPDAARRMFPPISADGRELTLLALSGGADYGAFGAGVLNGWSRKGDRPQFSVVTGVSTGALIAPFAFLGSDYDSALAQVYTNISARDIYRMRFPLVIPGSVSAASTRPLERLIAARISDAMIDAVAQEHRRGRRLFVGTANLDAQRTVIWDMGAIAASRAASRYVLFRKVLLASSSIPALFPPVVIDAAVGRRIIQELHVDGGTTAQILTLPIQTIVDNATNRPAGPVHLYLVVNNRLGGAFQFTKGKIGQVLKHAFALSLQSSLYTLVSQTYLYAEDHKLDFRLAYISNEFPPSDVDMFDTAFMRRLYAFGLERGANGNAWSNRPPDQSDLLSVGSDTLPKEDKDH
ncbi:patatin-like phospholipase family protein [Sphingobium ummariense]